MIEIDRENWDADIAEQPTPEGSGMIKVCFKYVGILLPLPAEDPNKET